MAEGDSIIRSLKNGEDVGKLATEIQTYLAPLLKSKASLSASAFNKYGLFCMRLLRACVESLGKSKLGSPDVANTIQVAHISYKCVQLSHQHVQLIPLALEKLLFHIMSQLLSKNLLSDALTIAGFLQKELKAFQSSGTMTSEQEGDFTNIAKHSFDTLLKAALRISDPKAKPSSSRRQLSLNTGQQALQILLLSNVDPEWFLQRVTSVAKHFEEMFQGSVAEYESISQFCQAVYGDVLEKTSTTSADKTHALVCLLRLGFQVCHYLQLARKEKEAMIFMSQVTQDIQNTSKDGIDNLSQDLLFASAAVFKASALCSIAVGGNTSPKPDWKGIRTYLEETNKVVKDRMGKVEHHTGMALLEAYNQLRKSLDNLLNVGGQGQCTLSMITRDFLSVETALTIFMDVLQVQAGQGKEQKRSKGKLEHQQCIKLQMATVSLLLQLMKQYISGKADRDVLPGSLMAVQRAMGIIEDVSSGNGGGMSTDELKYLGSHIYNLSISVYNRGWYEDALPLIQTACELLHRWCQSSGQPGSARELKLAQRFCFLSECQLKLDLCQDAMSSAALALLAEPSHMTAQVESWVRAKREAVEKDGDLRSRTLRDAILSLDTVVLDQNQMIEILQEELRVLQTQTLRHVSSYEQYCVICDLLEVQGDSRLQERAHTMVQLAQLLLSSAGTITANCTAVECCEEAVFLLEEIAANQGSGHEVSMTTLHDDLATAYMWLYMCKRQESLAQVPKLEPSKNQQDADKDSQLTYTENDTSLSKLFADINLQGCQLGPVEVTMTYLDRALENWCHVIKEGFDLSVVRTVEATSKCLKIASAVYGLSGRPYHQACTLHLLATVMEAVQNYEEAVFSVAMATSSLCLHGNSWHATHLLSKAKGMAEKLGQDSRALVMLNVAKSHFLLLTGEVSAGWRLLCEVLTSPVVEECSTVCYILSAQARHVQSLYLRLPHRQTDMDIPEESCSEKALDAFRVRISMARLLFGEELKETDQQVMAGAGSNAAVKTKRGCPHLPWWCCDDLLMSLLDMGKLYSDQGCVKEAKSYFLKGLEIAANFRLPRRCAHFLTMLAEVELHRGLTEDSQLLLKCACSVLASADNQQDLKKPLLDKDFSVSRISVSKDSVSFDDQSPDLSKDIQTTMEKQKLERKKDTRKERKSGGCFGFDSLDSEGEEEDEENFIRSKPLSVSQQLEDDGIDSDLEDYGKHQLSFPILQIPDFVGHKDTCACSMCRDIVSQSAYLDVFLTATECALSESLPSVAMATATTSRKIHEKICSCTSAVMKDFSFKSDPSLVEGRTKKTKPNTAKKNSNNEDCRHMFDPHLALLHCRLSEAYIIQEDFFKAHSCIQAGLLLFQGKVRGVHLHSNTQAHLLYNSALCAILQEAAKCNCSLFDVLNCNQSSVVDTVDNLGKCMEKLSLKSAQNEDFGAGKMEAKGSELDKCEDANGDQHLQALEKNTTAPSVKQRIRKTRMPVIKVLPAEVEEVVLNSDSDDVFITSKPETSGKCVTKATATKSLRRKKTESTAEDSNIDPDVIPDSDEDNILVVNKSGTTRKFFTSKSSAKGSVSRQTDVNSTVQRPLLVTVGIAADDYTYVESPETSKARRGRGRGRATCKTTGTGKKAVKASKGLPEITETSSKRKPRYTKTSEKNASKDAVSTQPKSRKGRCTKTPVFISTDSDSDVPASVEPATQKKRPQRKGSKVVYKEQSSSDEVETTVVQPEPTRGRTTRQTKTSASTRGRGRRVAKTAPVHDSSSGDEILRDASSEEEYAPIVKRKGRATKASTTRGRKASARPKPSTEEVEVLRECVQIGEEDSTLGSSVLTTSSMHEAVPVLGGRTTPCGSSIADATVQLENAYSLIQHTRPSLLSRMVLQLLFLCCPEHSTPQAAYYMSEACAVTLRHQMLASLHKKIKNLQKAEMRSMTESMEQLSLDKAPCTQQEIHHLRTKLDIFSLGSRHTEHSYTAHNMQEVLAKQLPDGWTVCCLALVSINPSCHGNKPTQQLLVITRLQANSDPLIVKIPISQAMLEREILEKLDSILLENKTSVATQDKKLFWKTRQELDAKLKDLTKAMENELLGCCKGVVLGHHGDKKKDKQLNSAAVNISKALGSDGNIDFQLLRVLLDSWPHLRKRQKQESVAFLLGTSTSSPLVQNGLDLLQKEANTLTDAEDMQDRGPVILILDEHLQRLPWENTPILQRGKVSRMPSVRFVLSHLHTMRSMAGSVLHDGVDQNNTYYVLNPRNDLAKTQATFQTDFKKRGWRGVSGVSPTSEQYIRALTNHDLFVYCGHGAGQVYLKGDEIQKKITTRAATLLMGCASGRLFVEGRMEAWGMAFNYLLSGCPSIVANLWEVTDLDIDRFLQALLKTWLTSHPDSTLLEFVSQSREACKLRHLIGAAPVVYGFPVHVK